MLALLSTLAAPRPDAAGRAGQLQTPTGCISLATDSEVVDDAWCADNCAENPTADVCVGNCQCPLLAITGAVDHATDDEMQKSEGGEASCTSKSETISADWCNSVCSETPDTEACEPVCDCPCMNNACKQRSKKDPAPPKPRIFGGWTNCAESGMFFSKNNMKMERNVKQSTTLAQKQQGSGSCGKDESDILTIIDPSYVPVMGIDPPDPDLRAGNREPSYNHMWGGNAVLPGRFGGAGVAPILGEGSDYQYYWITFGGEDTDSADWADSAEQDILDAGANGAAFDIEGGVTAEGMMAWIKSMRKKHPDWTYVHVPKSGINTFSDGTYAHDYVGYDPEGGSPDFVAPMMYYSNYNSYPKMDISNPSSAGASEALAALKDLREAGWPASRTILTYQSFDAARARTTGLTTLLPLLGKLLSTDFEFDVINWGEKITLKGPYAGVLGWPAQCGYSDRRCWPEADQSNMVEVLKGAREVGVNRHELPDPQDEWMLHELRSPSNATIARERMQRKQHGKSGGGGGGRNPNAGGSKQHGKP
jgi:hypothetical protein